MKSIAFAIPFAVVLAFAPSAARAGCPQVEPGCDAVVELEARLEGAPACVRLDKVEPENGCVCYGSVALANDCAFELVAQDFAFVNDKTTVLPGETLSLDIDGSPTGDAVGGPPGRNHEELNLQADGQSFKLILDFTVEHRVIETGCNVSGGSRPGLAAVGLGLAALLFARRRAR